MDPFSLEIAAAFGAVAVAALLWIKSEITTNRYRNENDALADAEQRRLTLVREQTHIKLVWRLDQQSERLIDQQKQLAKVERALVKLHYMQREYRSKDSAEKAQLRALLNECLGTKEEQHHGLERN